MACVLAECELLYGAHGIPSFTLACALVDGKKRMVPAKLEYAAARRAAHRGLADAPGRRRTDARGQAEAGPHQWIPKI